jgi:hypothetical protein
MRIFSIILVLATLFFISKSIFGLIFTSISWRKKSKKLNEWSEFNTKLLAWGDEIQDKSVKQEYLEYCIDKVMGIKNIDINNIANMDLSATKQEVIRKYSKHIPSLKKEVRDQKINKILN